MIGRIHHVEYPLVFPFKLSYGTFYERSGMIIELSEDGHKGFGEMSFVPYYGKDEEVIAEQVHHMLVWLEDAGEDWTPWDLYQRLMETFAPDLFLLSAVDCALYDLYGRKIGKPVWQVVGGSRVVNAQSSLTLTEDDWEEKLNWGWPVLKLKMGFEGDMDLLKAVRQRYDGKLRIDANSGWSLDGLEARIDRLLEWGIELVEQPVPKKDDHLLKGRDFTIPIAADESVQGPDDLEEIAKIYRVANLKLQKCGGITPALEMIRTCHDLGLKVMAGCMTESSVGIGAMAHLASYFQFLDLDGEHLILPQYGDSYFVEKGKVRLSNEPGLGQDFSNFGL